MTEAAAAGQGRSVVSTGELIGRGADLARVQALLEGGAARLVTLTGPGGVGKTRLADRVAADRVRSGEGRVVFIALAAIGEDDRVLPAVASVLEVGEPRSGSPLPVIAAALCEPAALLVLDNLEHLPGVGAIVADLLAAAPNLTILATSRARLHLRAEAVVEIAPLAVPEVGLGADPDALGRVAAVELFVRRVREVLPEFAVTERNAAAVGEICRRLEGLPLAIELVARRSRTLSVAEILARLEAQAPLPAAPKRDAPSRQRSMEASIRWSYGLLPAAARAGLCRLAVFPGSFDLGAAGDVAGVEEIHLETLLDHHLVVRVAAGDEEARFRLAEPIKQFGVDRLRDTGIEAAARDRHAAYVRDLTERLETQYATEDGAAALESVERRLDDVLTALAWTTAGGDVRVAARIAVAMDVAWVLRVHWATSHRWVHRVLAVARETERLDDDLVARLLKIAANVSYHAERLDESEPLSEEAVDIGRRSGDRRTLVDVLAFRVETLRALGDFARAEEAQQEMLALAAALDDPVATFRATGAAGTLALFRGDLERAERMFQAALDAARTQRHPRNIANLLHFLGYVAALQGDFAGGRAALQEARVLQSAFVDTLYLSTIWGLARLELLAGNATDAAPWLSEALAGRFARGEETRTRDAMLDMARLALLARRPELAARFFGAVDAGSAPLETNRLMSGLWRAAYAQAKEDLGEEAFRAAYRRGRVLSLAGAVEEALGFAAEVASGGLPGETEGLTPVGGTDEGVGLTAREVEVLRLVMDGRSDREIGAALFISPQTASTHVKNILKKLDVSSRTAAATVAIRRGLIVLSA